MGLNNQNTGLNRKALSRATIPTSLQARKVALWALRMALGEVRNDFLSVHPDRFIEIAGAQLKWSKSSFSRFFFYYDGPEDARTELEKLLPQAAWGQMASEKSFNTHQAFLAFRKFEPTAFNRLVITSKAALEASIVKEHDAVLSNVHMMQSLLGLSDTEADLLHLAAVACQSHAMRGMLRGSKIENESDGIAILANLISRAESEVKSAYKRAASLTNLGLLDRSDVVSDLYEMLALHWWFHPCFVEPHDSLEELMRHFLAPTVPGTLFSKDFPHLSEDFSALERYLKGAIKNRTKGVNLLVYGPTGTGKTSFAKALAQSLSMRLYEVTGHYDNGDPLSAGERMAFFKMSERFLAKRTDALILFDEIEDVFLKSNEPTRSLQNHRYAVTGKAWMNQTLESNQVPVIWVTNDIKKMDKAYLRRFSYHLEISTPPLCVRQTIAQDYLNKTGMRGEVIDQLASDATLTPAMLENTARVVELSGQCEPEEAEKLAQRVIEQCQAALGLSNAKSGRVHATEYSLDYLNLDCRYDIDRVISALQIKPRSSLCFYGLPGTGKTALAEYIATTLRRPLITRRASDLLSKWLGDSEKNLAAMFEQARVEQAVLLLDEADSFLRNREQAERRWEVSQVNELLQQMERYDGVFICATNLFEHIDPAALRRFSFKIAFKALRPEQRIQLFIQEALAGDVGGLIQAHADRLMQLDKLVPGDFSVVKRQSEILGEPLSPGDFLTELESECRLKPGIVQRTMGFVH